MARKKSTSKLLTEMAVTKRELAVLAVYLMGGDQKFVDTEDAAIKVAELAPGAFAWRKYPQQINLELVRAVLSDSKKKQFGALLHGTGTTGWRLSDAGVSWARSKGEAILREGKTNVSPWAGSADARRTTREIQRVKASAAWAQWVAGETIEARAAKLLFRIDDYATPEMRDQKIARLRSALFDDQEAVKFLDAAVTAVK